MGERLQGLLGSEGAVKGCVGCRGRGPQKLREGARGRGEGNGALQGQGVRCTKGGRSTGSMGEGSQVTSCAVRASPHALHPSLCLGGVLFSDLGLICPAVAACCPWGPRAPPAAVDSCCFPLQAVLQYISSPDGRADRGAGLMLLGFIIRSGPQVRLPLLLPLPCLHAQSSPSRLAAPAAAAPLATNTLSSIPPVLPVLGRLEIPWGGQAGGHIMGWKRVLQGCWDRVLMLQVGFGSRSMYC